MRMHSSMESDRAGRDRAERDLEAGGRFVRMAASVSAAKSSVGGASRLDTMSRSEPSPKCLAMAWSVASSVSRGAARNTSRRSLPGSPLSAISFEQTGQVGGSTVCVASPDHSASPQRMRFPVRPRYDAEIAAEIGQQEAATDVRKEADADLRHGELRVLGHHAVRAVKGDTHPAAHDDAIDQRDVGLPKRAICGVEPVLVGEELDRRRAGAAGLVDVHDIAAGRKTPCPRP